MPGWWAPPAVACMALPQGCPLEEAVEAAAEAVAEPNESRREGGSERTGVPTVLAAAEAEAPWGAP